jgi:hypothetical protein
LADAKLSALSVIADVRSFELENRRNAANPKQTLLYVHSVSFFLLSCLVD